MTKQNERAGSYPTWSPDDDARLLARCAARQVKGEQAWRAIAEHFPGRSFFAVRQRYLILRMKAAGIARNRKRKSRAVKGRKRFAPTASPLQLRPLLPEHKTLTAAFFGDPLPGRSALDQKRSAQA